MRRPLTAALLLGVLNAVVAVVVLAVVDLATPDTGWFAYAPLDDPDVVVVEDTRFPWAYVAVPLALVVTDAVAVTALLRRR